MFEKNAYVVYGSEGVCLVRDICSMSFDPLGEAATYYLLSPVNSQEAKIFVPVDSAPLTAKMRSLMTKEEIDRTIDAVAGKKLAWINDRKRRAAAFRTVRNEMRCDRLLMLACCLYMHKCELAAKGKRMTFTDQEALTTAETMISREFSFSLGIPGEEVGPYIRARLGLEA